MHELDQAVEGILKNLAKAENIDLRLAVAQVGDSNEGNGSFIAGFEHRKQLGFDRFAALQHIMDVELAELITEDLRPMSARYDEHLARIERDNETQTLDEEQTFRWDTILEQFDSGWSGAIRGMVCRQVQARLLGKAE